MNKIIALSGLCIVLTGCAGGMYSGNSMQAESHLGHSAEMGRRYLLGRGAPQNEKKAFYYFNQAAEANDPVAQNEIAFMYASGKGVQRDDEKAFYWYQRAADHGLASAQYNLGIMYQYGIGTPANRELAMQWIKKSAAHGFEPARVALKSAS